VPVPYKINKKEFHQLTHNSVIFDNAKKRIESYEQAMQQLLIICNKFLAQNQSKLSAINVKVISLEKKNNLLCERT
jgi:mannose-1-phosphate guanylyltransferase